MRSGPAQPKGNTRPPVKGPNTAGPWDGTVSKPALRAKFQHPQIPPAPRGSRLSGRVWVIDGDTVCIGKTKVRLAGIDAPEIDMPYGQKSKWAMVEICKGHRITVVMHGETSYDRQVGTAYLPDGRDIGAEIVKRGLALDLATFSGGKYRKYEPDGARSKLAFGQFGHRSLYKKDSVRRG
ncbi:MAG: thermonuclease family protein [Pseudomonadota bacterium]